MKKWWGKKRNRIKTRVARNRKDKSPRMVFIRQGVFGALILLLIVGLITAVWYLTRLPSMTITTVEVVGGETLDHDYIKEVAEGELEGSYYRLVPKRFVWTYPDNAIAEAVLDVERVKNVLVDREKQTVTVVFEEYQPFALWCMEVSSRECLYLDRNGYAFGTAPRLDGGAFLRFSESNREPELRVDAFEKDFVRDTTEFIQELYDNLSLNVIQVEKIDEEEVTYHLAGGGSIKVTRSLTHAETLNNLATILNSEEFAHIEPGNFKYIDLRYGNKVFVNEELAPVATSTPAAGTSTVSDVAL